MPVVLDISSDEEQGLEEGPKSNDYDWINEMLLMSDEESDDSDEVVVIHENKPELKSKSSTLAVKDDDDDDCVVLEGDPENGVTSVDEDATGSDELFVTGEKGQIACRDYPHARHLCAKFPFSSTPHERHCDQCHCYVCDSLAPCLKWGTGILSSDHCHANDKTEMWKIQRKNFKVGKSSPLPASNNYGTSLHAGHPQCNEVVPLDITHLPPNSMLRNQTSRSTAMRTCPSLNSIPQNQASQPTIMCVLSPSLNSSVQNKVSSPNNIPVRSTTTTNLTIPNGANHGRYQESGSTMVRNRFRLHSLSRHILGVRSPAIQRVHHASSLGPQFIHSHMMSKGIGSTGDTLRANHSVHGSSGFSNHVNPAQQCDRYHTATGFSNDRNRNGPNGVWFPNNLPLYPRPSSEPVSPSCVGQHVVPSEIQAYNQPLSQSNDGQDFYQSCIQGNDAPSSYVACLNSNQHQIGSQNENGNGNITQCGIASPDTYQPKPPEDTSQGIEPLIEGSHLQSSGYINQPPNVKESSAQITATGSIEPPIECSHLPSSLIDFENWLLNEDLPQW